MLACRTAFAGSFLGEETRDGQEETVRTPGFGRSVQCAETDGPSARIPLSECLCPGRNNKGSPRFSARPSDREAFVAASLDRLSKEIRNLHTTQQALFAAVDSLTRLFLTCIPEPPPEALDQAKRRARLRYERYLVSVAQNMTSDSRATLTELVDCG